MTLTCPPRKPPQPTCSSLIDPEHDRLVLVREIARERLGRDISPPCQWRWIRHGVRGDRLEAVNMLGRWYTTERAWGAFVTAQTATMLGDDATAPTARTPEKEASLRSAGLLK